MTNEREWWLVADFDNPKVEWVEVERPLLDGLPDDWWYVRGLGLLREGERREGESLFPTHDAAYDAVEAHIRSALAALQEQLREIAHERMRT